MASAVHTDGFTQINNTAVDALSAKASACSKGYLRGLEYHLAFLKYLGRSACKLQTPLCNRASFYRTSIIETISRRWIKALSRRTSPNSILNSPRYQLVIVGSGMDSLPLRLFEDENLKKQLICFELDAEIVVQAKLNALISAPTTSSLIGSSLGDDGISKIRKKQQNTGPKKRWFWQSDHFRMIGVDFLKDPNTFTESLDLLRFDPELPTLIIVECVLSYLPSNNANTLLSWASKMSNHESSTLLLYESLPNMRGDYRKTLEQHFACRQVSLLNTTLPSENKKKTQQHYPGTSGIVCLREQVLLNGWLEVEGIDMNEAAERYTSVTDRLRIHKLEPFDEHAALHCFHRSYGLVIATLSSSAAAAAVGSDNMFSHLCQKTNDTIDATVLVKKELSSDEITIEEVTVDVGIEVADKVVEIITTANQMLCEDYPAVRRFWKNALRKDLSNPLQFYCESVPSSKSGGTINMENCATNNRRLWVARDWSKQGNVVGCIAVAEGYDNNNNNNVKDNLKSLVLELRRLVVVPTYLRKGIGSQLVHKVIEFAQQRNSLFNTVSSGDASETTFDVKNQEKENSHSIKLQLTCLDGEQVAASMPACQLYEKCGFIKRPQETVLNPNVPMCEYCMTIT